MAFRKRLKIPLPLDCGLDCILPQLLGDKNGRLKPRGNGSFISIM